MSTCSTISILLNTNTDIPVYLTIYCHWDGYLSHNGKLLYENYNSVDKVLKLIKGGDLSSLAEKIEPDTTLPHTFNEPQNNVCVYYKRDRGDKNCEPQISFSRKDYDNICDNSWSDFNYLFKDGRWLYRRCVTDDWNILLPSDWLIS